MPLLIAGVGCRTSPPEPVQFDYRGRLSPTDKVDAVKAARTSPADAMAQPHQLVVGKVDTLDRRAYVATDSLAAVDQSDRLVCPHLFPQTTSTEVATDTLVPADRSNTAPFYAQLPAKDTATAIGHESVHRYFDKPKREAYAFYLPSFNLAYRGVTALSFNFSDPTGQEPHTVLSPLVHSVNAGWLPPRRIDRDIKVRWAPMEWITAGPYKTVYVVPETPDPNQPTPTEPITHELKKVMRIVNIVNLVTLPDEVPVPFLSATLSRDVDAFAWTFNAIIKSQQTADLVSPKGGALRELRLTINGDTWVFFVSKIARAKSFGSDTWTLTAYSRSKLLDQPYSELKTHTEASAATASQIATNILFGSGFTIDWLAPDWNLPANTYSYSAQADIQAILKLSTAIGAVVRPDNATNKITVEPRFKHSAWHWESEQEDRVIPVGLFKDRAEEWQPKPKYNGVYVAGQENGALVKVRKQGSAGDKLLPDIVDGLLTDTIANTERGRIELSKAGHKEVFNGTLFYQESYVDIGELVKVVDGGDSWKGVVQANTIAISKMGADVRQNVSIMRHYE